MPNLQTSAGRVAYSDTGTGPILVLLHATLHDRRDYDSSASRAGSQPPRPRRRLARPRRVRRRRGRPASDRPVAGRRP